MLLGNLGRQFPIRLGTRAAHDIGGTQYGRPDFHDVGTLWVNQSLQPELGCPGGSHAASPGGMTTTIGERTKHS
jgi:hypothetical protein